MEHPTPGPFETKLSGYVEWCVLALAAAILLVAGSYKLSEAPAVWFDEGIYSQAAMNLAEHGTQQLQTAPGTFISNSYLTVGYPLFFPVSISYRLFGVGVWQGRAVMMLFILAFAAASYALVRMLFGRWQAAWTLLLLATFPILYGNGKPVLGEVPGMLFLVLTFIALLILERSNFRNIWAYLGSGFAAGLCIVTKPIFILLLPALAVTWFIRRRTIKVHWGGFLLAITAFVLPVLLWAYIQFGGDGTLSKQLEYYLASPYPTNDKLGRAITNFLQFFTQTTPLYTTVTIVLWSVSMFIRKRKGVLISIVELLMLLFCFFILGAYLRIEGWYRYFFPAQMTALLFLPYSITLIFHYISGKVFWLRKAPWIPYVVLSLLVTMQAYQLAHDSYVAGYYQSHATADLYAKLGSLGPQSSFFLANAPEIAMFLPSRNYYQYINAAPDLILGADQIPMLVEGKTDYAIASSDTYKNNLEFFKNYSLAFVVGKYDLFKRK